MRTLCGRGTKALISAFGWGTLPLTERAWDSKLSGHENTFCRGSVYFLRLFVGTTSSLYSFVFLSQIVVRFVSESPTLRSKFFVSSGRCD